MKEKVKNWLFIISFSIVALAFMFFFGWYLPSKGGCYDGDLNTVCSIGGTYNGRIITIYPVRMTTYTDYMTVASHEWAHYYYDKLSYTGFLKEWTLAIKNCSIQTTYAKNYSNRDLRIKEEWAECFSNGVGICCEKKMGIVNKVKKVMSND